MLGEIVNSKYKKIGLFLVLALVLLYALENSFLLYTIGNTTFTYGVKPSCFMILAFLLRYKLPKIHLIGKLHHQIIIYVWAFNFSMIYIATYILGGFMQGFGKSPYSHTLLGILTNVFLAGSMLIGRESVRAYLVGSFMKRNSKKALISIVLLMTLTSIRFSEFTGITDLKGLVIFGSESLLPALCTNILATYLVWYGGALASLIYLGIIESVMWLSPILPALNWLGKGVVGMLVPAFCLFYMVDAYLKMTKDIKPYKEKEEKLWEWVLGTVGSIVFIWFVVGVFSIYPSAIATGSMEPIIRPGDVVLLEKIKDIKDIEALKVGDVIQFRRENILITHRIVEVLQEEGLLGYRTKGDNNSVEDSEIVSAQDIKGILKGVVPKIGWPTLIFKSSSPDILHEVEF